MGGKMDKMGQGNNRNRELAALDIIQTLNILKEKCSTNQNVFSICLTLDILSSKLTNKTSLKNIDVLKSMLVSTYDDSDVPKEYDKKKIVEVCNFIEETYKSNLIHEVIDNIDNKYNSNFIEEKEMKHNTQCVECKNTIDSANRLLICKDCGAHFCETCETWFRGSRKAGESPLCKKCFNPNESQISQIKKIFNRKKPFSIILTVIIMLCIIGIILNGIGFLQINIKENQTQNLSSQHELVNKFGMHFILVPKGSFLMGSELDSSEKPVREVTFTKQFYIGKYEITQQQWTNITGTKNPSYFQLPNIGQMETNRPVENVTWSMAQEFIAKLNEKDPTHKYRLPTEAEWEYACRAGTNEENEFDLADYGWYKENSGFETHIVGSKLPNAWGIYDMHGNVIEWVQDKWHWNYDGAPIDGSAWEDGNSSARVGRGGSNSCESIWCRSAFRNGYEPNVTDGSYGFRLVMEI